MKEEPDWTLVPHPVKTAAAQVPAARSAARLRHIGDAMMLIDEEARTTGSLASVIRKRPWLWPAVAALLLLATAGLAYSYVRSELRRRRKTRRAFRLLLQRDPTSSASRQTGDGSLLSRDGRFNNVHSCGFDRWISLDAHPLPGTEGATFIFWSPDGRYVGSRARGKLKKIDIFGGPAQTFATWRVGFVGFVESAGDIIFAVAARPCSECHRVEERPFL
jgi:hypothetical protein